MKTVERILIKLIIIQVIFLCVTQVAFRFENRMIQLSKLSQYEGVNKNNYTKVIETFDSFSE